MKKEPVEVRFWRHVNQLGPDDCWLWTAHINKKGRGQAWVGGGKSEAASRVAYRLVIGEIPDGMYVCHHCDNPACVNPLHLFLGTQDDNMQDMVDKGRSNKPVGIRNGRAKLNEDSVRFIRANYKYRSPTYGQKQLAKMFGVCVLTIQEVLDGRKWLHVV